MKIRNVFIYLTAFAIAMGYMEGAIVVYLREIFYPEGFVFPLQPITYQIAITEIIREAATMVMIITIAIITGRTKTERFAFFLYCFAVWDIVYYIALYLVLGWPPSLLTWDILFLIPVTWVGPVIGPVINSVSMIVFAFIISGFVSKNPKTKINMSEWVLLIGGSLVVILSYTEDYMNYMLKEFSFFEIIFPEEGQKLMEFASAYIPNSFAWWIFLAGEGGILAAILLFLLRNIRSHQISKY